MTKLIPEVLAEYQLYQTHAERIMFLRRNATPAFRELMQYAFLPEIAFEPEFKNPPVYKHDPGHEGLSPSSLFVESRRLYLFTTLYSQLRPNVTMQRKIALYIQILEALHPSESALLIQIINRNIDVPELTLDILKEAIPATFNVKLPENLVKNVGSQVQRKK